MKNHRDIVDNALDLLRSDPSSAQSLNPDLENRLMQEFQNRPTNSRFLHSRGLVVALSVLLVSGVAFAAGGGISRLRQWLFTVEVNGGVSSVRVGENGSQTMSINTDDGGTATVHVEKGSSADGSDSTRVTILKSDDNSQQEEVAKIIRRAGPGPAEQSYTADILNGYEPVAEWTRPNGGVNQVYQLPAEDGAGSRFFMLTTPDENVADKNAAPAIRLLGQTPMALVPGVKPDVQMSDDGVVTITQDDGNGRVMKMKFKSKSSVSDRANEHEPLDLNLLDGKVKIKVEEQKQGQ